MSNLKKRLLTYLKFKNIKFQKINANAKLNPTPVGRCNLGKLIRTGSMSETLEEKLDDFLEQENF